MSLYDCGDDLICAALDKAGVNLFASKFHKTEEPKLIRALKDLANAKIEDDYTYKFQPGKGVFDGNRLTLFIFNPNLGEEDDTVFRTVFYDQV